MWRDPHPGAAPDGVDWQRVAGLAVRHNVEPLMHRSGRLSSLGAPGWLVERIRERDRRRALGALALLALQRELMAALADAGIDAIVLKGAPLAIDVFGDVMARANADVDVLVDPCDLGRAVRVVEATGLRWVGWKLPDPSNTPIADGPKSAMLMHAAFAGPLGRVELHWRLAPNAHLLPVDPAWLRRPRVVAVGDDLIPALPLDAGLLHLAVHGAVHRWDSLKWLADLPALLAAHPHLLKQERVPALADAVGVERCLAAGLLLAERVLGPFLAADERAWAASVRGTGPLLRQSGAALAGERIIEGGVGRRGLPAHVVGRLALRQGARYRGEELSTMLLEASRLHTATDRPVTALAAAPLRWVRRREDWRP